MFFSTTNIVYESAQAQVQQPSLMEALLSMAPFIFFILIIFHFVYQRPMQKERDAHTKLLNGLLVGDQVITIGGIHGEVAKVEDQFVVIKSGDKSKIKVSKTAIKHKLSDKGE